MKLLMSSLQSVSMVLLAGAILSFLVPEGKLWRGMRFLLSLCLLLSLLAPFREAHWSFSGLFSGLLPRAEESAASAQVGMEDALAGWYETAWQEAVVQYLRQEGIAASAAGSVYKSESGSIVIQQIRVGIKDATSPQTVREKIEEAFGVTPVVES